MNCEICGCSENTLISKQIREGEGRIVRCNQCGLIFQDAKFSLNQIKQYYNNEYTKTNSLDSDSIQTPREHFVDRLATLSLSLNKIKEILLDNYKNTSSKINILEVGASTGELLFSIRNELSDKINIDKTIGIELNSEFCDWANSNLEDIDMIDRDLNEVEFDIKFDFIYSNYTLDHLINPKETLLKMKSLLKKDGIIYLELPNRDEALNYYLSPKTQDSYQIFSWHKAHMFYFTCDSITKMMDNIGMDVQLDCFHEYSLKNYLNWYFCGTPGKRFEKEINDVDFFFGDSEFEKEMNELFRYAEKRFKEIMKTTYSGNTICVTAKLKGEGHE